MSLHIGAAPGDIAPTVLMPGDPYRARWAAEKFLDDARLVNEVRGMLGYTGTWQGKPVTIHGSGMGMPSLAIYATEILKDYGATTVIRIGSCGAMQDHVRLRDVVLATAASSVGMPSEATFREVRYAPAADFGLLAAAHAAATARGLRFHTGPIHSSGAFYDARTDLMDTLRNYGTLAVEMEAAELYTLAALHGARALAVLTVSDHILTGEELPAKDREQSFGEMVQVALEAAFA